MRRRRAILMRGPVMMDLAGLELSATEREQLAHPAVGGVILFSRNHADPDQLAALTGAIRRCRPELLIAADTEGGRVQRFHKGFLRLPPAAAYGRLPSDAGTAAAEAGGWLLAAELRAVDIDLAFAPVLDLDTGVSGVIGDRAFAGTPQAVTTLARAFARGLRAAGMAATAKHFPGHGHVAPDSHRELPVDPRSADAIEAQDLAPYRGLIADGLESVMAAHVLYPGVDKRPASVSPFWLVELLRGQLGFAGAVFSDDLSMGGLAAWGDVIARARAALAAGCDMLPVCNRPGELAALLERGRLQADAAADRRLAALTGRGRPDVLKALRKSEDYMKYFNILNKYIQVKVEK